MCSARFASAVLGRAGLISRSAAWGRALQCRMAWAVTASGPIGRASWKRPGARLVDLAGSATRCLAFRPHLQPAGDTLYIEPTPYNEDEDAFVVEVWLNLVSGEGLCRRKGPFYLWADVMVCGWRFCGEAATLRNRNNPQASLLCNGCFADCRELTRWAVRRALTARVEER